MRARPFKPCTILSPSELKSKAQ